MEYSRNLNRRKIANRVIISWIIIALGSAMVGGGIGYAASVHMTAKGNQGTTEGAAEEFAVYGTYDDRIFTDEVSLDWEDDSEFKPLAVELDETNQEFLYYLCKGYNIDFILAAAVIQVESNCKPSVISASDDYGLMQINKVNHDELTKAIGVTDYLDPVQNMRAGCYVLRKLFEKYQNPALVLMAYNMGEKGAKRLWREGLYETDYTRKVFMVQKKLQKKRVTG